MGVERSVHTQAAAWTGLRPSENSPCAEGQQGLSVWDGNCHTGSWPWSSPASCFVFSIGLTPKTLVFTEMLHVAAAPVSPSAHGMYLLNSSVNRPRAFFVDPGTCGGILCVGRWD